MDADANASKCRSDPLERGWRMEAVATPCGMRLFKKPLFPREITLHYITLHVW